MKVIFYAVPDPEKSSGGPRTRVLEMQKMLSSKGSHCIVGSPLKKLKASLKAGKSDVLYIESSTNRLKIIDFFCLFILNRKVLKTKLFIRDVYIELFPENYLTFRSKLTVFFHKISNHFYYRISDEFFFPTVEMGKVYFELNKFTKKPFSSLPPGTFIPSVNFNSEMHIASRLEKIKILYLGGTKYKFSGFQDFISLSREMSEKYDFWIITNDDLTKYDLKNINLLTGLKHDEVISKIHEIAPTFALHTRPRNSYDDITFPIKFLDFISTLVPIITLKHSPLLTLLDKDYPFFIESIDTNATSRIIHNIEENPEIYIDTVNMLDQKRTDLTYSNLYAKIIS